VTKYCYACGASIDARAEICPKCGVRQPGGPVPQAAPGDPAVRQASGKKLAAGICGILLGSLGIHKFILGLTTPGLIMLLVSVLTCVGAIPMAIIGLVEGIIYLTKSDEDFYQTYVVEKKGWF
jgi:TM2 domain-containing membrane protein YozV